MMEFAWFGLEYVAVVGDAGIFRCTIVISLMEFTGGEDHESLICL